MKRYDDDMWDRGASYEPYVGRWSRLVARQFVPWLDVPSGAKWLDVGCGTGNLSQTILDIAHPHTVLGIDSSEGYIGFARKQIKDPRVSLLLYLLAITIFTWRCPSTSG